jgi:hypothetical protein
MPFSAIGDRRFPYPHARVSAAVLEVIPACGFAIDPEGGNKAGSASSAGNQVWEEITVSVREISKSETEVVIRAELTGDLAEPATKSEWRNLVNITLVLNAVHDELTKRKRR